MAAKWAKVIRETMIEYIDKQQAMILANQRRLERSCKALLETIHETEVQPDLVVSGKTVTMVPKSL